MTFTRLFTFGFLLSIGISASKIFLYQSFDWEHSSAVHYAFWLVAIVFSVALIRRLGVISFLEAIIVSSVWMLLHLLVDAIITAQILGYRIFIDIPFLIGYLIVVVAMFLFHKKRHVAIRREMKSK